MNIRKKCQIQKKKNSPNHPHHIFRKYFSFMYPVHGFEEETKFHVPGYMDLKEKQNSSTWYMRIYLFFYFFWFFPSKLRHFKRKSAEKMKEIKKMEKINKFHLPCTWIWRNIKIPWYMRKKKKNFFEFLLIFFSQFSLKIIRKCHFWIFYLQFTPNFEQIRLV